MSRLFEEIGEETIIQAEHVECSLREFAEGLKEIEIMVRDRRQLAESEAESSDNKES